jgi:hypothetical protein
MSNQRWSKYYEKNKEAVVARTKAWRAKNPERTRQHQKDRYARARIKVLSWYAKGIPKCACCGETELQFLALDHINGKSREKRKECGIKFAVKDTCGTTYRFCATTAIWLKDFMENVLIATNNRHSDRERFALLLGTLLSA